MIWRIFQFKNQCFYLRIFILFFVCQARIHQFFLDQVKTHPVLLLFSILGIMISLAASSSHSNNPTINNNNLLKFRCSKIQPNQPKKHNLSLIFPRQLAKKKNNQLNHPPSWILTPINHQCSAKTIKMKRKNKKRQKIQNKSQFSQNRLPWVYFSRQKFNPKKMFQNRPKSN